MITGQGRAIPGTDSGRFAQALWAKLALLWDEVRIGSFDLSRLAFIVLAMVLQSVVLVSPGHFRPAGNAYFAVQVALGTLLSLGAALVATLPLRPFLALRVRRFLGIGSLVALIVLSIVGASFAVNGARNMLQGTPYNNDGAVMDLYAATQVLHGHNPYERANIVTALAQLDAPSTTTTPLMDGQFRGAQAYPSAGAVQQVFLNVLRHQPRTIPPEFESKYNYPTGSFLFILPFVWAGMHDMRFLYALALIAIGVYLYWRLPRSLRILAPLLVLADAPLIQLTGGGQPDPLYGLLVMIAFAEWNRSQLSPLAMGVAIATKQLAWFFLPFYLIFVVRSLGWREGMKRSAIMGAVFLVLNGPFILWSPGGYLASVFGPMRDPMFPLGIGIIALFVSNVVPLLPKICFTLAEIGSWLAGVVAFGRLRVLTLAAAVPLSALPLFFAWRSLTNYFYLVPLITLAVIFASQQPRSEPSEG